MNLDFDLANVALTEFGVGREGDNGQAYVALPVDEHVQDALREMVEETRKALDADENGPAIYEPSERHASTEYLTLPLTDGNASTIRQLHEAKNLELAGDALDEPAGVFCYFARLTDKKGRQLTALRRATQFKGVLKKRLIRFVSDSLQLIEDAVFSLDRDFDLLADSATVHILRPSGFEFAGKLQHAILEAVPNNAKAIAKDLAFVLFDDVQAYAAKHPRAARYLASIRTHEIKLIEKALLKKLCKETGVEVTESKGKVVVASGHEMGFLEVLDRRRYELELVKGSPERFKAASRRKLDG